MTRHVHKRFTVRECGKGPVVAGLESVSAENAVLRRLACDIPLSLLAIGERTYGRRMGETYEIVRVDSPITGAT